MDWTQASQSELDSAAAAIGAEYERREQATFRQRLAEVKAGTRPADEEYWEHLSPKETLEAVNRGQMEHLRIGADRRLSRRR